MQIDMDYDFSQFNDKEFETFVADLLSEYFRKRIERFKPGKDGGVDARYFSEKNQEIILQCKHYIGTGYKGLIRKLKYEEIKKVAALSPERYIFVTSLPLSRQNKKEIREIFKPYIVRDDDIIGQEDLNQILSINPVIEEKYFKLWITSTNVFQRILNNAIKGRSKYELERIQENAYKYVQTGNHEKAYKILKENHVVIISGEPGIGKTTLAENLALIYASKGFEFIDIQESLSEAEDVYKTESKQIYYFDDFLGSNYFEIIENKKDSHIIKFIERIKRDKSKRFILTSRTNIFNSGRLHSPVFFNYKIEKQEYLISINSLSDLDRAKILYNHIWYSGLPKEYVDQIYKSKRYKKIIRHKNFNPRLIEFITDIDRIVISRDFKYWDYILNTLENPIDVWDDCFKRQNNPYVRNLVNLTVFNGGKIDEEGLIKSYSSLNKSKSLSNPSHTEKDFRSMSQLAVKSFLNRSKLYKNAEFTLFNPSIADYVLKEYSKDLEELKLIFKSLSSVRSLYQLKALEKENIISSSDVEELKQFLFEDANGRKKSYDYRIYISHLVKNKKINEKKVLKLIHEIISDPSEINEIVKFLNLMIEYRYQVKCKDFSFLIDVTEHFSFDELDIKTFGLFIDIFGLKEGSIVNYLKKITEEFLREELTNIESDIDVTKYINRGGFYNEIQHDDEGVKNEIYDTICQILEEMESDAINDLDLDISEVVNEVDVDKMFQDFYESQVNDYDGERAFGKLNNIDKDIDDLFERT